MGRFVASRLAGLKLAWIILVLLVPIAVFAFLLVRSLESELSAIKREQFGAQYVRLAMPLMIDAVEEKKDPAAIKAFAISAKAAAHELGIEGPHRAFAEQLQGTGLSYRAVVAQVSEHISLAVATSGLTQDADPESFALASLAGQNLPELIKDFERLGETSSPITNMAVSDAERITYLALIVGAWRENSDRVNASLEAARRAAQAPDTYKNSFAYRSAMNEMTGDLLRGLIDSRVAPGDRRAVFHRELSLQRDVYSGNLRGLWLESQARLDGLLASRASAIEQKIAWMTGLSFLAIVLGVGSAAHMFKSTLKRLDEVEAARLEAEAMSSRLEVINSEIAGLNGELSATVTQLKDAQDELLSKGRMEQLGHLTATVAHELRNPLGAVRTSVFLLQRKLSGKGLGVEPQLLRINNGVVRCDDIITQLLDFSRSSSPSLQSEDLDGWLQKVLEEEAQHLPSMVEIEFIPGLGGAPVAIDGARLSRAIINLINNASEAMVGKGDDPSKFTTHQPRIIIELKTTQRGFEIVVRDNGPGIAPEHLARIMEPLFTTKSFGTGLGLPAVQRIMEQHGGGLEIQSALGKGSSFTAWIAAQQQATAA